MAKLTATAAKFIGLDAQVVVRFTARDLASIDAQVSNLRSKGFRATRSDLIRRATLRHLAQEERRT
jgi:hypothetical protein